MGCGGDGPGWVDVMTENTYKKTQSLRDLDLWQKKNAKNALSSFTLELTARCNNNCRHCYINLPENDPQALAEELSFAEITNIIDQAADLGVVWCLLTGGEPLLREDFEEIYLYLKRKGLLVTVFTNATLISEKHIKLFKKYPPRDLEISVYGITAATYAAVTRKPHLFDSFRNGLDLLLKNAIPVNLKNVTIKANVKEFHDIAAFCANHSKEPFRFDPLIHLRFDHDKKRNAEIRRQRLAPEEIAALERSDKARYQAMQNNCDRLILPLCPEEERHYIFRCGAGVSDFVVSHNGLYRLCSSLWHPDSMYDLRKRTILEARKHLVAKVRSTKSANPRFLESCAVCPLINLCIWCPAHSFLETGQMDEPCRYFCDVAASRRQSLQHEP